MPCAFCSMKYLFFFPLFFQGVTKRIGGGMHELAAKVDEYARGMVGPLGSTLFEELGLYYIGPVDGHNVEDLICVLQEVASLNSMGPVLVHVITEENREVENNPKSGVEGILPLISLLLWCSFHILYKTLH